MIIDLKQERVDCGYSVKEASVMVEISEKSLSRYEKTPGKTPVHIFLKLRSIYKDVANT